MIDVLPVGLVTFAFDRIVVVVVVAAAEYIALLETVFGGLRVAGSLIEVVPHILETGKARITQFIAVFLLLLLLLLLMLLLLLLGHQIISVAVQMVVKSAGYSTARVFQQLLRLPYSNN